MAKSSPPPIITLIAVAALIVVSATQLPAAGTSPDLLTPNGTALVRLRFIGQWLGARVGYDAQSLTITFAFEGRSVALQLNSREASVDGRPILLASPPTEIDGATYVPLGFLAVYLGVPVDWDPVQRAAKVTHPVSGETLTVRGDSQGGSATSAALTPGWDAPESDVARAVTPRRADGPRWLQVNEVADLPAHVDPDSLIVSDSGAHWAMLEDTGDGYRVVDDRGLSPRVYRRCRPPFFASGSERLAYWATAKDGKVLLVVDGQEFPTSFARPGMLVFSPNGRRWAIVGWQGNPHRTDDRTAVVIADGVEVGRYWDAGIPCFSADSSRLAYLAIDASTRDLSLVADGIASPISSDPAIELIYKVGPNLSFQTDLAFGSDGALFSLFHSERGWEVRAGSHVMATYARSKFHADATEAAGAFHMGHIVYPSSLVVAEDAPVAGWWARPQKNSPWVCCFNGREFPVNDEVKPADDRIVISPDGRHVAFRVRHFEGKGANRRQVGESVSIDGKRGDKYEWVESIQFSSDSRHCSYRARRVGAWRDTYIIDGKKAGPG